MQHMSELQEVVYVIRPASSLLQPHAALIVRKYLLVVRLVQLQPIVVVMQEQLIASCLVSLKGTSGNTLSMQPAQVGRQLKHAPHLQTV